MTLSLTWWCLICSYISTWHQPSTGCRWSLHHLHILSPPLTSYSHSTVSSLHFSRDPLFPPLTACLNLIDYLHPFRDTLFLPLTACLNISLSCLLSASFQGPFIPASHSMSEPQFTPPQRGCQMSGTGMQGIVTPQPLIQRCFAFIGTLRYSTVQQEELNYLYIRGLASRLLKSFLNLSHKTYAASIS